MPLPSRLFAAAALAALPCFSAHASCGSAYCSLNTDLAAQAAGIAEGNSFDLRYEAIDQRQPRSGSRNVGVGQVPRHHDEVSTRNRNLIGTYSRSFASGWAVSLAAPFVAREHVHIHNHHGQQFRDEWDFKGVGDVRVTGRYQAALAGADDAPRTAGFIVGVKLPTGRTGVANGNGEVAERTLQPGTGTTDVLLGAFFHQQLPGQGASWFAQAQAQRALRKHDGFRPGAQLSVDVGYARAFTDRFSGIVQVNAVLKGRDAGTAAEPEDSGSRSLFVSPGVSYQLTDAVRAYAFYQQPVRRHVNGVQLTADRAIVVGLSTHF
jgi:hypothetical protein